VPPYTPDWAESSDSQDLLHAAARHLVPLPTEDAAEGDVVVMKMRDRGPAKHVGILALGAARHETLIHAYSGHGVVESPLTPAWKRRIVGVFRFPDRSN
jgi:NlpC/P60 family putative phage cell wall peptidase